MTTVIAALGSDFVVLGADSQGTLDAGGARTESKDLVKLKRINDKVGILYSGDVNAAEYLIDKFQNKLKSTNSDNVTKIATDFRHMCIKEYNEHAGLEATYLPDFNFIIAGLDTTGGITPKVYSMGSSSGFKMGKYPSGYGIGGKPFIARYLFRQKYNENKSKDDLCKLVGQSIYDTKKVDGDVGGQIRMAIIDSEDGFKDVPENDVYDEYITKWD
ncbi:hypothetical protein [Nitrosopumilus piranensis]|uniref:Putative Proteasome endopeptidase complex n=1 Tax=Nitrosopumilus piranensis TaxID=1582439 RepID=A0A0C5BYY6_9ARCH|nr:hypothetical protein [Nitrosopumilus piranensis]AJM92205.1 putative Proteasome endopeptidase complex [Nitrosopumilus piranensis]